MPAGNNAVYLHLLKQHHASLCASSSLAAPHYALAVQSLNRCPVAMDSIEELDALEGFSAGVRRRLHEMVESAGGLESAKRAIEEERIKKRGRRSLVQDLDEMEAQEEEIAIQADIAGPSRQTSSKRQATMARAKPRASSEQGISRTTSASSSSKSRRSESTEGDEGRASTTTAQKQVQSRHKSAYMPAPRSGAWGILIAMYLLSSEEGNAGGASETSYHSKESIISRGQKYCRASYTYTVSRKSGSSSASAGGAKYLTAWSAMKTLLNRGMAWQKGRPATFGLSEEGRQVAREIAVKEGKEDEEEVFEGGWGRQGAQVIEAVRADESRIPSMTVPRSALLEQLEVLETSSLVTTGKRKASAKRAVAPTDSVRTPAQTARSRQPSKTTASSDASDDEALFSSDKEATESTSSGPPPPRPPLASLSNRTVKTTFAPLKLPPKTKANPITALYLPTKERPRAQSTLKLPPRTYDAQPLAQTRVPSSCTEVIVIDD
ncbi:hypothetical protein BCV69DRAFT_281708 [Microstroma glucosiphilum]|uniref:Crossover junction endonuclease MUS81 n=1 Tax=Pseudomicrostroma glucosiphilum TaxID=1684307 RepID=A0A316UAB0_9BASI|nr:hypothetical protein BCV69DRAFT_281708 [Pseudomicrostroma glucosiphilum]PWN21778.1 hypothetical protein BCV69DRAFT_281708 [Pseudomicrostroma glucosiphilum]